MVNVIIPIALAILVVAILSFLSKRMARKRKITIYEDVRTSPERRTISWWVGPTQFNNLNRAREFARSLK